MLHSDHVCTFSPVFISHTITFSRAGETASNLLFPFLPFSSRSVLVLRLHITPKQSPGTYLKYCFVRGIIETTRGRARIEDKSVGGVCCGCGLTSKIYKIIQNYASPSVSSQFKEK